jgi:hypothetical protein
MKIYQVDVRQYRNIDQQFSNMTSMSIGISNNPCRLDIGLPSDLRRCRYQLRNAELPAIQIAEVFVQEPVRMICLDPGRTMPTTVHTRRFGDLEPGGHTGAAAAPAPVFGASLGPASRGHHA